MERIPCNHEGIEKGFHIIHAVDCNENPIPPVVPTNKAESKPIDFSLVDLDVRPPMSTGT